jgi:regulator of protease activity HflC (stomatin/prohibitin superfamily)
MKAVRVISAIIIGLWMLPKMCLEQIGPDKIGVRKSIEGGVSEEDSLPGWHLSLPLVHGWYELDATLHYLEFNDDQGQALDVRTKENNIIFIDCVIVYRIIPGEAWMIVREGFADTYPTKVKSAAAGILREKLADLSNIDVQDPDKREAATKVALPAVNQAIRQYHVEATHVTVRAIRFRPQYEEKLQNKQYFVVQGKLDEALQRQSKAAQETDTLEKTIDKDIALKTEEWNKKIEELRAKFEVEIAGIRAEGLTYDRAKRADGDAAFSKAIAEGDLAEAKAQALGEKLRAEALASQAGRTYSAIEAVKNFKIGDILVNSSDPEFLQKCCSMQAWRRFFLPEGGAP